MDWVLGPSRVDPSVQCSALRANPRSQPAAMDEEFVEVGGVDDLETGDEQEPQQEEQPKKVEEPAPVEAEGDGAGGAEALERPQPDLQAELQQQDDKRAGAGNDAGPMDVDEAR